jgi:thiol:disulfide interchange protein DsbA
MFSFVNFGCTDPKDFEKSNDIASAEQTIEADAAPLNPQIEASNWIEGTHYIIVSDEVSPTKEVVEYFSFWCPACYRFESVATKIKSGLPDDTNFKKVHVNFMGFTTKEVQDEATKAMLIGRQIGSEELLNAAIFAHIHEQGRKIESMSDLKELFISYDISEADFNNRLNDSVVLSDLLSQNNNEITKFKKYLKSVPNIIVNGKYQVNLSQQMTKKNIIELINWLTLQN